MDGTELSLSNFTNPQILIPIDTIETCVCCWACNCLCYSTFCTTSISQNAKISWNTSSPECIHSVEKGGCAWIRAYACECTNTVCIEEVCVKRSSMQQRVIAVVLQSVEYRWNKPFFYSSVTLTFSRQSSLLAYNMTINSHRYQQQIRLHYMNFTSNGCWRITMVVVTSSGGWGRYGHQQTDLGRLKQNKSYWSSGF